MKKATKKKKWLVSSWRNPRELASGMREREGTRSDAMKHAKKLKKGGSEGEESCTFVFFPSCLHTLVRSLKGRRSYAVLVALHTWVLAAQYTQGESSRRRSAHFFCILAIQKISHGTWKWEGGLRRSCVIILSLHLLPITCMIKGLRE